jgi:hypothetical protein
VTEPPTGRLSSRPRRRATPALQPFGLLACRSLSLPAPLPTHSTKAQTDEIYPLPQVMRESDTFQDAMRTITAVWGLYFLARATVRLTALLTLNTDLYALVIALSDAPFLIAILAWSVYHTVS